MKNSRHSLTVGTIIVALVMLAGSTQAQQVPFPQTAAGVPGPVPGTAMTKAYVQMVGRMAYLWGWALVDNANRHADFSKAPEPGLIGGVWPQVKDLQKALKAKVLAPGAATVNCPIVSVEP